MKDGVMADGHGNLAACGGDLAAIECERPDHMICLDGVVDGRLAQIGSVEPIIDADGTRQMARLEDERMTTRDDYTDTEWELLTDLPRLAGFGAMASELSGPVTSTRELWASMMEMMQAARTTYAGNALIRDAAAAISESEDGADLTESDWDPQSGEDLGQEIVEQALLTAPQVRQILAAQAAAEEAAAYTAWVLGIARAGVEGARTGLFGMTGEQVTAPEAQFVQDLATALQGTESGEPGKRGRTNRAGAPGRPGSVLS